MNEYVIVSFLVKPHVQVYPRNNQPLHLTVLGTFYSDMSSGEIAEKLEVLLEEYGSLQLKTESYEMYGRDNDVPVVTVKLSSSLFHLHKRILGMLEPKAKLKNPDYNGDGYHPHITDKNQLVELNDAICIDTLYLVQFTEGAGYIKRLFPLTGNM